MIRALTRTSFVLASVALAASACDTKRDAAGEAPRITSAESPLASATATTADSPYPGCATLRQVETADTVRVVGDKLFAIEGPAFGVYDVADVDHTSRLGSIAIAGTPVGVFIRGDLAVIAASDTEADKPGHFERSSMLRVIDTRDLAHAMPHDLVIEGDIDDVHAIGDTFYVLRTTDGASGIVSSYRLTDGRLELRGELRAPGRAASFAIGPTKMVVARRTTADASQLAFADIGTDPTGAFDARGSVAVRGAVAIGIEPSLDDEERYVRVLTCASEACNSNEPALVTVVDAKNIDAPRVVAEVTLPPARGSLVAAFDRDRLFVARDGGYIGENGTSEIRAVNLADPSNVVVSPPLAVRGTITRVVPIGDRVIAIGTRGAPPAPVHVSVTELRVSPRPSLSAIGAAEFGEDWTATPMRGGAAVDDAGRVALPFSSWSVAEQRTANGVELFGHAPRFVATGTFPQRGNVMRALFMKGRLVAVTDRGVSVMPKPSRE